MFQFPGFPRYALSIHACVTGLPPAVFPHSDIKGSMPACGSPLLFAACHVLLRRLVPGHPPCALLRLIFLEILFLRRVFKFSGSIAFPLQILQLVFQDFFLVFSSLCSCQGAPGIFVPFRILSGTLKTIQRKETSLFLFADFSPLHRFLSASSLYGFRRNRPRT